MSSVAQRHRLPRHWKQNYRFFFFSLGVFIGLFFLWFALLGFCLLAFGWAFCVAAGCCQTTYMQCFSFLFVVISCYFLICSFPQVPRWEQQFDKCISPVVMWGHSQGAERNVMDESDDKQMRSGWCQKTRSYLGETDCAIHLLSTQLSLLLLLLLWEEIRRKRAQKGWDHAYILRERPQTWLKPATCVLWDDQSKNNRWIRNSKIIRLHVVLARAKTLECWFGHTFIIKCLLDESKEKYDWIKCGCALWPWACLLIRITF